VFGVHLFQAGFDHFKVGAEALGSIFLQEDAQAIVHLLDDLFQDVDLSCMIVFLPEAPHHSAAFPDLKEILLLDAHGLSLWFAG
jgi:hypothetical protein